MQEQPSILLGLAEEDLANDPHGYPVRFQCWFGGNDQKTIGAAYYYVRRFAWLREREQLHIAVLCLRVYDIVLRTQVAATLRQWQHLFIKLMVNKETYKDFPSVAEGSRPEVFTCFVNCSVFVTANTRGA
ncbi:hypothetical protein [Mesorhizobium sp. M0243]|uniref:hypothetical protein n=1 Tax=Mesorhizobium sp. M0243 TaxID=2956925 RepID=UPI003335C0F1